MTHDRLDFKSSGPRMSSGTRQVYDVTSKWQTLGRNSAKVLYIHLCGVCVQAMHCTHTTGGEQLQYTV